MWDWELMNDIKPIWQRPAKEVEEDEYKAFYKTFSRVSQPVLYTQRINSYDPLWLLGSVQVESFFIFRTLMSPCLTFTSPLKERSPSSPSSLSLHLHPEAFSMSMEPRKMTSSR